MKLFLLDAMALIYRAHFAFSKNPRINSQGLNTGAAFGFTNTLLEVLQREKPTHLGVAFDTPVPTFRHVAFEAYKAQRQEQPEDITTAIPYVKRIVRAFRLPVLELDGYEADDVIGTIAKRAAKEGFTVFMMTPDKDYGQLVDDHIRLYKPAFMGNGVEIMGPQEVCDRWGIQHVDQVTDILGLMGDSVDNIPGIPGIGEKTAAKLIAEYGSVEALIAQADQLKGKLADNVRQFAQQGLLSKQLATINTDVPIHVDLASMHYQGFDREALGAVFAELEFKSLSVKLLGETSPKLPVAPAKAAPAKGKPSNPMQTSLFGGEAATPVTTVPAVPEGDGWETAPPLDDEQPPILTDLQDIHRTAHDYYAITTAEDRRQLAWHLRQQSSFSFDTETTSTDALQAELVGLSFAWKVGEAYYVPVPATKAEAMAVLEDFREVLADPAIGKTGQNLKYDLTVLSNYGIEVCGPLFDTMLAHYLIEPDAPHGMDAMSLKYLRYRPVPIEELIGKKGKGQGSMRDVPLERITEYAAEDADITLRLEHTLRPLLNDKLQELLVRVEMPLMQVLMDMERTGIRIHTEALQAYSGQLAGELATLEAQIYTLAGEQFNISSPQQLGLILFDKLRLSDKPKKTKTGQYATGEEILLPLAEQHEIVAKILEYRQLQKLKSTYIDALPTLISPTDGRIHTTYHQAVAATGRLSSANPNLQNIPIRTDKGREIRKAFVPKDDQHVILSADYSQIELRIMAAFSQDQTMLDAFAHGRDIHTATAAKIYRVALEEVTGDMRRKAKTANFGIIYGISAFGLSQRLNISRKEAGALIDTYFAEFPAVRRYMDEVIGLAREQGYVETILGRRRYLPDIHSRNFTLRGFAERNAINAPIQGSAADLIKKAMIHIHQWLQQEKLKTKLILQVHDELVFDAHVEEVHYVAEHVRRLMENAHDMGVPLIVETGTGKDWLEAH